MRFHCEARAASALEGTLNNRSINQSIIVKQIWLILIFVNIYIWYIYYFFFVVFTLFSTFLVFISFTFFLLLIIFTLLISNEFAPRASRRANQIKSKIKFPVLFKSSWLALVKEQYLKWDFLDLLKGYLRAQ